MARLLSATVVAVFFFNSLILSAQTQPNPSNAQAVALVNASMQAVMGTAPTIQDLKLSGTGLWMSGPDSLSGNVTLEVKGKLRAGLRSMRFRDLR